MNDELGGIVMRERLDGRAVAFRLFRSSQESWETLLGNAAEFAAGIGKERLINISHACDQSDGTVVVWYWD